MEKSSIKKYRLNIIIEYCDENHAKRFRSTLYEIITFLAWLHKFEYSISVEHPFFSEEDSAERLFDKEQTDLVYFRSTKETTISQKDFRKLINSIFGKYLSVFSQGIEVSFQLLSALVEFPFPEEYYRPLNYPFVEVHKNNESSVCIPLSVFSQIVGEDSECYLN